MQCCAIPSLATTRFSKTERDFYAHGVPNWSPFGVQTQLTLDSLIVRWHRCRRSLIQRFAFLQPAGRADQYGYFRMRRDSGAVSFLIG